MAAVEEAATLHGDFLRSPLTDEKVETWWVDMLTSVVLEREGCKLYRNLPDKKAAPAGTKAAFMTILHGEITICRTVVALFAPPHPPTTAAERLLNLAATYHLNQLSRRLRELGEPTLNHLPPYDKKEAGRLRDKLAPLVTANLALIRQGRNHDRRESPWDENSG